MSQAAVLTQLRTIELHDIPHAPLKAGEVLVGIRVALTDGTDLKAYRRGHPKMPMPTRLGHEFSGNVLAVGAGVANFKIGDRIATVHSAPCGSCYWCGVQEEELCATIMDRLLLGGYAHTIIVPAEIIAQNAYRFDENLSYEAAAFLEPLACVLHAWNNVRIDPGMTVGIYGTGGFALLHAMVARALGVQQPIVIGRSAVAIERARKLGVGDVIESVGHDPLEYIRERSAGRGADLVIECTGAQQVWESAPRLCRRGGTVLLFGGLASGSQVSYDAARLHYDEIHLQSPFHFTPRAVRRAFELLLSGQIDPRALLTSSYRLSEIREAFEALDRGDDIKIAIYPDQQ
jgi:L-iditol 2-dehydrogenase